MRQNLTIFRPFPSPLHATARILLILKNVHFLSTYLVKNIFKILFKADFINNSTKFKNYW